LKYYQYVGDTHEKTVFFVLLGKEASNP
jgi:hypothetical protein